MRPRASSATAGTLPSWQYIFVSSVFVGRGVMGLSHCCCRATDENTLVPAEVYPVHQQIPLSVVGTFVEPTCIRCSDQGLLGTVVCCDRLVGWSARPKRSPATVIRGAAAGAQHYRDRTEADDVETSRLRCNFADDGAAHAVGAGLLRAGVPTVLHVGCRSDRSSIRRHQQRDEPIIEERGPTDVPEGPPSSSKDGHPSTPGLGQRFRPRCFTLSTANNV